MAIQQALYLGEKGTLHLTIKLSRGVSGCGVLWVLLLSHQGILRRMHCNLFSQEFSMGCWGLFGLVWFLRRKNAECREGFVKIISSVGHHRQDEWKQTL